MPGNIKLATAEVINRIEQQRLSEPYEVSAGEFTNAAQSNNGDLASAGAEPNSSGDQSDVESGRVGSEERQLVSDVLVDLERMIVSDDWLFANEKADAADAQRNRRKKFVLPALDQLGRSVVTCYSLKHYIELLQPHHRGSIANWLYQNTSRSLAKLFRSPNATLVFHADQFEGLLRVVRIALHSKYTNLVSSGYAQFVEHAPVIYVSANVCYGGIQPFLAFELGISDAKIIPNRKSDDGLEAMDITVLSEQLANDSQNGKVAVIVIAAAGSHLFGTSDSLEELEKLKEKYGFWLHVDGLDLASLCLSQSNDQADKLQKISDSYFLPLGQWLGVPAVPFITVHRTVDFIKPNYSEKLNSIAFWVVVKHLTVEGISERIQNAFNLTKAVETCLAKYPDFIILPSWLRQLKKTKKAEPGSNLVLFQYNFPKKYSVKETHESSASPEVEHLLGSDYLDALNTWIGQGLCADCKYLGLQLVHVQDRGVCVRYCALETACVLRTTLEHVNKFATQLSQIVAIVDATVSARAVFLELLSQFPSLRIVSVHKWAGVGAVIYVPTMLREVSDWNDKQRQQISHLNIELIHVLRSNDHAFSLGECSTGLMCVKFGMLASADDLLDLISLVAKVGKEIEESSKYIEAMADLVRQGIEAANEDLKKENENRLLQEGILRQVPVVGSFLNWWSPLGKDAANVRGRTFDLVSGQIISTESVYKRHLQMKSGGESLEDEVPSTPAELHAPSSLPPGNAESINATESLPEESIAAGKQ